MCVCVCVEVWKNERVWRYVEVCGGGGWGQRVDRLQQWNRRMGTPPWPHARHYKHDMHAPQRHARPAARARTCGLNTSVARSL